MKINLKSIAGLAAKSVFRWLIIFLPGFILSIIFFSVSLYLLYNGNSDASSIEGVGKLAVHGGGKIGGLVVACIEFLRLFTIDPFAMILCLMSSSLMIYVYFALASKFSLSATFSDIWNSNLNSWFSEKITSYIDKVTTKSKKISAVDIKVSKKLRLIQSVRKDSTTSKWQRRLLTFILKKVDLEDADFSNDNVKFSNILQEKNKTAANKLSKPNKKLIYVAYLIHVIVFVLAVVYDNK